MSTETILILGGSYAGISAAHYALKHTIPQLPKKDDVTYNVTLVNPSKDLYWRFAAPRALVSKKMMPYDQIFYPIEPAFTYAFPKFKFIQGSATHVDAAGQNVSVTTVDGETQTIPYAALIIATGFSTPSPLFTQATDRAALEAVYDAFQQGLKSAKTVIIGGGGPVGVETAGEVAEILNGRPGFMASGPKNPKASVQLVCADKKLLPVLRESIGKTAEQFLAKLGCSVTYNTRVTSATQTDDGKYTVELSNGQTLAADIYIDATGSRPNTSFLPKPWLDGRGKLECNPQTLRVEHETAGPRIYALGDVGSYTRGGVLDLNLAVPAVMTNLKQDLLRHLAGTVFAGDRHYVASDKEQQICPIGTQKGVGAFNGFRVPSQMVWMIKGRDYLISQLAGATVRGDQWKKETKFTPVQATGRAGLSQG